MELLLEAQAHGVVVVGPLGVLSQTGLLGLVPQLHQGGDPLLGQLFLARQDVHGQLLVVVQVFVVHLIQDHHILHQGALVLLQLVGDLVDVDLGLVVAGLQGLDAGAGLLEQAQEALLVLLGVEALELHHQGPDHLAHLAQVLGADGGQGGVREVGHVLLGPRAVLQGEVGVGDIDLLGEVMDDLLLRFREHGIVGACLGCGGLGLLGGQLQGGNGLEAGDLGDLFGFLHQGLRGLFGAFKLHFGNLIHRLYPPYGFFAELYFFILSQKPS